MVTKSSSSESAYSAAMTRSEFGEADQTETYFENYKSNLTSKLINLRIGSYSYTGSTGLIWNNSSFGTWNSYYWKSSTDIPAEQRIKELYMWNDFSESFTTTTYKNTGVTTAGWGTAGSAAFAPNQILQTIDIGSDIKLSTTKYTHFMVNPIGSLFWNLVGSVSSDGGTTWTPVTSFGVEQTLTSTTGSQCIIKLVNPSAGSVWVYDLIGYFHTNDIS